MMKRVSAPTVADVARVAGVGAITVSRVINGTGYISAAKQEIVRRAVAQLGYRPNEAARILKGARAHMVGLIVPELSDRFFGLCASAVESYAAEHGYFTLIVTSQRDCEVENNVIEMMLGQNIAGLIIVPSGSCDNLDKFVERNIPIVAIDRPIPDLLTEQVVVDNFAGARLAVEHLIQHGHRRIACVGYDAAFFTIRNRIRGYEAAMQAAQLKTRIYSNAFTKQSVLRLVEQWKDSLNRPTAVFSLNNVATLHILETLRQVSLKVPDEIALIGFDDFELAPLLSPPITAVRQPAGDLGAGAAKLLFKRIHSGTATKKITNLQLVLPVELIVRGSCGCAATASSNQRPPEPPS